MPTVALPGTHDGGTTEDFGIRARSRPRWMCVDWAATDIAVFPKSVPPQRVRENFALFDFELPASGIDEITAPNKDEAGRTGPSPDQFDYIPR